MTSTSRTDPQEEDSDTLGKGQKARADATEKCRSDGPCTCEKIPGCPQSKRKANWNQDCDVISTPSVWQRLEVRKHPVGRVGGMGAPTRLVGESGTSTTRGGQFVNVCQHDECTHPS